MKRILLFSALTTLIAPALSAQVTIPFEVPDPSLKEFVSARSKNQRPMIYKRPAAASNVLWSYCTEDCKYGWHPLSWNRTQYEDDPDNWNICRMYAGIQYACISKIEKWTEIESELGGAWVPNDSIRTVETFKLSKKDITDRDNMVSFEQAGGLYVVSYGDGGWPESFQQYLIGKYVDGYVVYPYACSVGINYEASHPGILNGTVSDTGFDKFTRRDVDYLLAHARKLGTPLVEYGYIDAEGNRQTTTCAFEPESSTVPSKGETVRGVSDRDHMAKETDPALSRQPVEEKIHTAVETQPEFPGGEAGIYKFLAANIRYPEAARHAEIQGRVIVNIVIEKDGSISNVQVIKGLDRDLDREAVRVVKKLPNFISPAKIKGTPVRYSMNIPINFKL